MPAPWRSLILLALPCALAMAQTTPPAPNPTAPGDAPTDPAGTATLSGTVTDPTGALVPGATVTLALDAKPLRTTTADSAARYTFARLAAGSYTVSATFPGFATRTVAAVVLAAGDRRSVNLALPIATAQQRVEVGPEGAGADPARNGDSTVLRGSALATLSSNSSLMLQQLQGMSGAGTNAQLYVDGFSGGRMPPRDSIREIRINENPYSAEYDSFGEGRIEVFTKPGTDTLHGNLGATGSDSAFDSRNPYSPERQPFYSTQIFADLSGPISKKLSYSATLYQFRFNNSAIVNAEILDGAADQVAFTAAVPSPTLNTSFSPRLDAQLGKSNTLTARYSLDQSSQTNAGVGQFALASQAFDSRSTAQTLQLSDTETFGPKVVNELRFQYIRTRASQTAASSDPALVVQGAFTGGGNNLGRFTDNQDQYELQNYLSVDHKQHFLRLGVRQRFNRDSNRSTANYNGEYIFPTLLAYQRTVQGLQNGLTPAEIRASGGGASQFNITAGNPSAAILVADTGLYAEDTWTVSPKLTLTYGLRFETQNYIHDHADFAPRAAFAYQLGGTKSKPPTYTLRGGAGLFYTRLPPSNILQAVRQDGIHQQQFVITSPDTYPAVPPPGSLSSSTSPTIFRISPSYTSPYTLQAGVGVDRSLGKHGRAGVSYTNSRGVHLLLSRNINAPLPGTYNPADPASGVRPLGGTANLYQYESTGVSRQDRLTVNTQINNGEKFFLFANYTYRRLRSDTSGGFPSNQYRIGQDYGRDSNDTRHRLFLGIFGEFPFGFNGGPFLIAQSGAPFNIVLGEDLNGDSQFNDRPSFATDLAAPGVLRTAFGNFNTLPAAADPRIPINFGNGPGLLILNTYFGRAFRFGPVVKPPKDAPAPPPPPAGKKPPPPERRFNLQLNVEADNVLNHTNPAAPVGTLGSPLFGRSNALNTFFSGGSANRTLNLEMFLRF